MRIVSLTIIWILISGHLAAAALSKAGEKLCIHVTQEAVVSKPEVRLEQIATLGGPAELLDKAKATTIGTFSSVGQILSVDWNTIFSRLASAGIYAWQVELSGAQVATIRRHETRVEPQQMTEFARVYLDSQLAGEKIVSITLVGTPSVVVLNEPNAVVEMTAQMSRYQASGTKKITVTVKREGIPIDQREVTFSVHYQVRRAVAMRTIPAGTIIRSEDVKIEQTESSNPEPAGWKEPFGFSARRKISEGAVIAAEWLGSADAPMLIRRNQQVLVQFQTGAMYLSAPGQALDEGRVGELIRVRRGQKPDERIIYCTIQADGTVSPQI